MKKRVKKLVAALTSAMLLAMPFFAMPLFVNAEVVEDPDVKLGVDIENPEYYLNEAWTAYSTSVDLEYMSLYMGGSTADDVDYINLYFQTLDYSQQDFTVSYTLPFNLYITDFVGYYSDVDPDWGEDCGTIVSYSASGRTLTVSGTTSDSGYFDVVFSGKITFGAALEDMFWIKPMKTQLNIAAEVAEQTGKATVAEATGDFALPYEIMKWLEDHPNVTLKYTLTYKDKEYNIVIKGGQKLAFPDIPWYGPEYLIGKFLQ